ncbi:MAG: ABC transporter ATP-binding protein [Chloroflexota bacterium]
MDHMNEPVLEAHELYRFYHAGEDETFALRGVSLTLHQGEFVAIVGPSGSGKSTLVHCLAGLDDPDGGWVTVAGKRLTRQPEPTRARLRAQRIGIVLQSDNLLPHLTIEANLRCAMLLAGRRQRPAIPSLLEEVGLVMRAAALPSQLSGGEQARAAVALALVNDPLVILADEPTGEVDALNEARVLTLLQTRVRDGKAVLVVTHSSAVARVAHRVLQLVDGRLINA